MATSFQEFALGHSLPTKRLKRLFTSTIVILITRIITHKKDPPSRSKIILKKIVANLEMSSLWEIATALLTLNALRF